MYKLLNNIVVCRKTLYKWKRLNNDKCPYCNDTESVIHIYFECSRITNIWVKLSQIININITWKRVLLGYTSNIDNLYNMLFSIVMYAIFKVWCSSTEDEDGYKNMDITSLIKKDLRNWTSILKLTAIGQDKEVFYKQTCFTFNNIIDNI